MRLGPIRRQGQRAAEGGDGFVEPPLVPEGSGQVVMGFGEVRVQRDRPLDTLHPPW